MKAASKAQCMVRRFGSVDDISHLPATPLQLLFLAQGTPFTNARPSPLPSLKDTPTISNAFKHLDTLLGTANCILTHQIIRDDLKRCQWTQVWKTSVGLEEFAGWPRSLPHRSAWPCPPRTPPFVCTSKDGQQVAVHVQESGLNLLGPTPRLPAGALTLYWVLGMRRVGFIKQG